MRRIILSVLVLFFSVWVGLKLIDDPGIALFIYHNWSVEMPLWFAALSFLVIMYLFYICMRLVEGIEQGFFRWKNWLRWRRKYKSYSKTNRGLLELIEGQWRNAENHLVEGIEQSDTPLINYLGAAKAASERGAFDKRDTYLRMAHELAPQESLAIGLVQVELQIKQQHFEQALATLTHLRHVAPKQPVVLHYLINVYEALGDWKGIIHLLPEIKKANLLATNDLERLEFQAFYALLQSSANRDISKQDWQNLWASLPKKLQRDPRIVFCYAKRLLKYPDSMSTVEELINKTVRKYWDGDLVKLYGLMPMANPQKQLSVAEDWLKLYPNQADLFLTLGRLCVRAELWGKATSYFEDAIKLDPTPEMYSELGRLNERLGEASLAAKNYYRGLVVAVKANMLQ